MNADDRSADGFTVSVGMHEDYLVVRVAGELDYQHAARLHERINYAWRVTPSSGVVLDLGGVSFCDSMGVGVLVLLLRQSREQRSPLVLSDVPALLKRILHVTGLRSAFRVAPTVEAAIESIKAAPEPEGADDVGPV
ncbi:STAS domain-containing protein [Nonomuraea sp. NPDC002799]